MISLGKTVKHDSVVICTDTVQVIISLGMLGAGEASDL